MFCNRISSNCHVIMDIISLSSSTKSGQCQSSYNYYAVATKEECRSHSRPRCGDPTNVNCRCARGATSGLVDRSAHWQCCLGMSLTSVKCMFSRYRSVHDAWSLQRQLSPRGLNCSTSVNILVQTQLMVKQLAMSDGRNSLCW